MNIFNIINVVSELCLHYYKTYYHILWDTDINISNKSIDILENNIIDGYLSMMKNKCVYDIMILSHNIYTHKQYIISENDINIDEAKSLITEYIKRKKISFNEPIISMSQNPIDIYFDITDSTIRWLLDLF